MSVKSVLTHGPVLKLVVIFSENATNLMYTCSEAYNVVKKFRKLKFIALVDKLEKGLQIFESIINYLQIYEDIMENVKFSEEEYNEYNGDVISHAAIKVNKDTNIGTMVRLVGQRIGIKRCNIVIGYHVCKNGKYIIIWPEYYTPSFDKFPVEMTRYQFSYRKQPIPNNLIVHN